MRLRGIQNIEQANAFVPEFIEDYNQRFTVKAQNGTDAHREVLHSSRELEWIFSLHHTRKLSKNLAFQFKNREIQLHNQGQGYRLRGATVTVCEAFDGSITILHQGQVLPYRILAEGEPPVPIHDEKSIHHTVTQAKAKQIANPRYKPAPDHPWNKMTKADVLNKTTAAK